MYTPLFAISTPTKTKLHNDLKYAPHAKLHCCVHSRPSSKGRFACQMNKQQRKVSHATNWSLHSGAFCLRECLLDYRLCCDRE
jgi:hypothetical protein